MAKPKNDPNEEAWTESPDQTMARLRGLEDPTAVEEAEQKRQDRRGKALAIVVMVIVLAALSAFAIALTISSQNQRKAEAAWDARQRACTSSIATAHQVTMAKDAIVDLLKDHEAAWLYAEFYTTSAAPGDITPDHPGKAQVMREAHLGSQPGDLSGALIERRGEKLILTVFATKSGLQLNHSSISPGYPTAQAEVHIETPTPACTAYLDRLFDR